MEFKASEYRVEDVLKIVRSWTELTQKAFGGSIGVSERTIQNYEGNKSRYTMETFLELCEKHDIEIIIRKSNNNNNKK